MRPNYLQAKWSWVMKSRGGVRPTYLQATLSCVMKRRGRVRPTSWHLSAAVLLSHSPAACCFSNTWTSCGSCSRQ